MANQSAAANVSSQIAKLFAEAKQLECEAQEKTAAAAAKYAEICALASPGCETTVSKPSGTAMPSRGLRLKRRIRIAKTGVKTHAWQKACKPIRRAA
jgi:hypothetical protein